MKIFKSLLCRITHPLAAVSVLTLCACGDDRYPDYRYRMTVEVETPSGVRTGSSVIEVRTKEIRTMQNASGRSWKSDLKGEAVAVDLAPGRTLFALLSKPDNAEYAKGVAFPALKPHRTDRGDFEGFREHLTAMTQVKGIHELPRTDWPLFVAFRDVRDPKTLYELKPDALSAVSGTASRIKRVTIEITTDPVSMAMAMRLPWLAEYRNKHFSGSRIRQFSDKSLTAHLGSGSFAVRTYQE